MKTRRLILTKGAAGRANGLIAGLCLVGLSVALGWASEKPGANAIRASMSCPRSPVREVRLVSIARVEHERPG